MVLQQFVCLGPSCSNAQFLKVVRSLLNSSFLVNGLCSNTLRSWQESPSAFGQFFWQMQTLPWECSQLWFHQPMPDQQSFILILGQVICLLLFLHVQFQSSGSCALPWEFQQMRPCGHRSLGQHILASACFVNEQDAEFFCKNFGCLLEVKCRVGKVPLGILQRQTQ